MDADESRSSRREEAQFGFDGKNRSSHVGCYCSGIPFVCIRVHSWFFLLRMNRWSALALLLAIAAALALRVPRLDTRPLHNDEAVNAGQSHRIYGSMAATSMTRTNIMGRLSITPRCRFSG
jgi:hypothetical protein